MSHNSADNRLSRGIHLLARFHATWSANFGISISKRRDTRVTPKKRFVRIRGLSFEFLRDIYIYFLKKIESNERTEDSFHNFLERLGNPSIECVNKNLIMCVSLSSNLTFRVQKKIIWTTELNGLNYSRKEKEYLWVYKIEREDRVLGTCYGQLPVDGSTVQKSLEYSRREIRITKIFSCKRYMKILWKFTLESNTIWKYHLLN